MRKRLFLSIVLILLLTVPLALLLRDFARDVFLVELWRVFWGARILFESLPQLPIWGLLLVALLVIALRSLVRRKGMRREEAEDEVEYQGQVRVLTRWIQRALEGEYFRWSLAQHLGGLTWEVMAHQERITPDQVKQRLRAGRLDLPPVIQAYLQSARSPSSTTPAGLLSRIRDRFGSSAQPPSLDPALEGVVRFLEDQLQLPAQPEARHQQGDQFRREAGS